MIPSTRWCFRRWTLFSAILLTGWAALATAAEPAPTAPRTPAELTAQDFFRPTAFRTVSLNPAGTHLALAAFEADADSTGLRVIDLARKKTTGLRGTADLNMGYVRWVGDDRIVFSLVRDKHFASGLLSVPRDNLDHPTVLNERDVVWILGVPAARPNNLFVAVLKSARDEGRPGPVVEVDVRRRFEQGGFDEDYTRATRIIDPPFDARILGWMLDRSGEVRYAFGYTQGTRRLFRLDGERKWTPLNLELDRFEPLAVDTDPNTLLVAKLTAEGTRELVRYNTADGSVGPVLLADPKFNFGEGEMLYSGDEQTVVGLQYAKQAPVQIWFRPEEQAIQQTLNAALPPNHVNLIVSRSRDDSRMVVLSLADNHPGQYYLYEPKKGTLAPVANLAPWLPEELLGTTRLLSYKARDGLRLDAYITLPLGHDVTKPAPMIVLPHGGPWVRDSWGYDAEAQFFTSRGYVVFQPNYRGSSGYNAEVSLKPRMEFLKMHEDVTDGVRALIKSGVADPKRLAIVGSSFGGYLAVCGAAFEPDLYRCAVTIAGVFDWARVLKEARAKDPDSLRYDQLVHELGDPKIQKEKFDSFSPILSAAKIKIPVFIAHGEDDRVADSSQSHRLAKALEKSGVPHETMFVSGEGHGFAALKHRAELYERIEVFLKKHL